MSKDPNAYLDTLARMEPDITMVDLTTAAPSIAISLTRIANSLEYIMGMLSKLEPIINEGLAQHAAEQADKGKGYR